MTDPWLGERNRMTQRIAQLEQEAAARDLYVLERLRLLRVAVASRIDDATEAGLREVWERFDLAILNTQAELRR